MSYPLIIQPEAEADLAAARAWYEGQRAGLGDDFVRAVEEALARACRAPTAHAVLRDGVRRELVRRFPYAVYYLFEDDLVVVLAILHVRRDPRAWHDRI